MINYSLVKRYAKVGDDTSVKLTYGTAQAVKTLNLNEFAKHIADHGSVYTSDVVFGVLEKFRSCLIEMLLESKRVKIDGLGTFYTTIENKGGALSEEEFSIGSNLKGLHIRFMPEQEQEMNISSRQFLKKAKFIDVKSLTGKVEEEEEEPEP